jgi:hypothetical protein
MKSVMIFLLSIGLFFPCLAQDKPANKRDCDIRRITGSVIADIFSVCDGGVHEPDILVRINFEMTEKRCEYEDGRVTFKIHLQFHGTGVGIRTGNEYVINAQVKSFEVFTQGCEHSFIGRLRQVLVSKGPLPNETVLMTFITTTNSECELGGSIMVEEICKD